MDFGIFNLMGFRERGKPSSQTLSEVVEQTCLAEQAGFGMAWFAEHHFSNYCICPSPLLMAAHVAGVTKRIRLATGILVLPLYNPARLISEIAFVDSLSNGRLVLGVGSGYQPYEFDRFGVGLEQSKAMSEEFVDMIKLALTQEFFSFEGKYYSMPETHIAVRPVQKLPEIWVGGDSEELQRYAAKNGFSPIVSGRGNDVETLIKKREQCERIFREEGRDPAKMPFGTLRQFCVTDSRKEALSFADNIRYQRRLAMSLRFRKEAMEGVMLADRPFEGELPLEQMIENMAIGSVAVCVERLVEEIRRVRPSHIAVTFNAGDFEHRSVMRSIERFGAEVIPGIEKELGPLASIGSAMAPAAS